MGIKVASAREEHSLDTVQDVNSGLAFKSPRRKVQKTNSTEIKLCKEDFINRYFGLYTWLKEV